MNGPAMSLIASQLICDAPECDHIERVPEIVASMVGKPCPKCGASLLTEEDFIAGEAIAGILRAIADVLPPVDDSQSSETVLMSFNPHNGGLNINLSPKTETE